ncbi:MAG: 2-hydroxyacyl-CoA dehydratase family protein [Atopococcus tabaci]|uniref:2-hydroxyacyl-CoA dehydratase family protein n=1 Tax=Atopococcus tabaci TaxID=269774 RepID=A0AA43UD41_9LACT|nr:2-hydroxyacyl-CoA dehydratase family protein [Atopococcus tabaci]
MIENLRREAYPAAIYKSREMPVVSYFGHIPWEIIYSFDVLPIRAYGIDYYVVEEEHSLCSMLNSTVEYLRRDKCPFMYASSYFIVDDYCPLRTQVIQEHFDPVYVYQDPDRLINFLEDTFEKEFDEEQFIQVTEKSARISELLVDIQYSNLPPSDINKYQYFTQYIFDLDERIQYLESVEFQKKKDQNFIELGQIAGIFQHFDQEVILEGRFCEGESHIVTESRGFNFIQEKYQRPVGQQPKFNVNRCELFKENYLKYEGED